MQIKITFLFKIYAISNPVFCNVKLITLYGFSANYTYTFIHLWYFGVLLTFLYCCFHVCRK